MKKILIANWKLNPITQTEAKKLASRIKLAKNVTVVICPPHPFLAVVNFPLKGAQDAFWHSKGPFTGQVSPATLKSLKIKYVIIGHSELRNVGETNEQIAAKVKEVLSFGITPVVCVGHGTTVTEDDLEVIDVLKEQLKIALHGVDNSKVIVAYEPVWALSTGKTSAHHAATPQHIEKVALYVRTKFNPGAIIYGGSVNATDARDILSLRHIDGALIGGASLVSSEFNSIIQTAAAL